MSNVNPPPNIDVPKQFLEDPETRDFFLKQGFMLYQLWLRTGGGDDVVNESNQFVTKSQAQINAIRNQIGSGDFLTSDETGFTVDSTNLSVDMTEA